MRLAFASPTYGPVEPAARNHQLGAVMRAAANGVTWVGNYCPDKVKFDASRNIVVREAFEAQEKDGREGILWCDSDIIPPIDGVRIAAYGHDFVTGFYYQKSAPYWPLVGTRRNPEKRGFTWLQAWPEDVCMELAHGGCGFGWVYTSMAMLR